MGNAIGEAECTLSDEEVQELSSHTHFSPQETRSLATHFSHIAATRKDDDLIDKSEFQAAIGFRNSFLLDRMFAVFDTDADGFINVFEFINSLSTLSSQAPDEEKLQFSFKLYDADGDGLISRVELTEILTAILREHQLALTDSEIGSIVAATLEEAHPGVTDRGISYEEYVAVAARHPKMLSALTLNLSSIIAEYTARYQAAPTESKTEESS